MDDLDPKFVNKKIGLHAHTTKSIRYVRKYEFLPASSKKKYQEVKLKVPDEYAFALMEMYDGRGLQWAIMHLIKLYVNPVRQDE